MADESVVNDLANVFLALSDKTRLRLVALMSGGETSVNLLAASVNESQPKVSRHLAYLRAMNVVTTRRDGKHIYYSIDKSSATASGKILAATAIALNGVPAEENVERIPEIEHGREKPRTDELPIFLL